jgi:phospho-N-acetylmuramoyl-pentapeptide-transferase
MTEAFTIFNVVRILTVATIAFVVALVLTPLWLRVLRSRFAPGKQIARADTPVFNALHAKKEGTPTMGGFVIWATVAVLAVIFWVLHLSVDGFWSRVNFLVRSETYLPLAFLVVAGLVGLADDIIGVRRRGGFGMKSRMLLYTVVAIIGAWWFVAKLGKDAVNIPLFGDVFIGPVWYFLVFVFIVVATAFSANETDGLDGLVGGTFMTMLAAYTAIAFDQGKMDLAVFLAAIMGALVAFLWWNIYPARFFMGDTGVMAIGFTLAAVAVLTNTPLLLPIIGIVMVIESASVLIQMASKRLRKKKVFISTPIHHHFEALGWHETQITMRFWMINAIGAVAGLIIFLADSKLPPLTGSVVRDLMDTVFR